MATSHDRDTLVDRGRPSSAGTSPTTAAAWTRSRSGPRSDLVECGGGWELKLPVEMSSGYDLAWMAARTRSTASSIGVRDVSMTRSALTGFSYGSEIPVNSRISPRRAFA